MESKVEEVDERGKNRKEIGREKEGEEEEFPLLRLIEHLPGVFEKEVLTSSRLNGTDLKFFARVNKKWRDAVRRAKKDEKAEEKLNFRVRELSSISTLEWTCEEGYPFDKSGWGRKKTHFIREVAQGGNVGLLRW